MPVGGFVAVVGIQLFNIWQIDRLEGRMIDLEKNLSGRTGGGTAEPRPSAAPAGKPGEGTGITAAGWGGRQAEIRFVEGAEAGAPLTLADKPRPQGDTYVYRRTSAPGKLNLYTTSEGDARNVLRECLEGMIRIRPEDPSQVDPALAVSWEVSEDKLTYTYHLRRGVLFADGRPFTSKDVAFSFATMRDPAVEAEHLRGDFEKVESMETPDDHTVVVHYREPDWAGLYYVGYHLNVLNSGWVEEEIPRLAAELKIANPSTKPGTPGFGEVFNQIRVPGPGTGPYMYPTTTYVKGEPVVLDKNPFYWGIQVMPEYYNFDHEKWVYIADEVAAFEAFRKGEYDVSVIDFDNYDDELSKDPTVMSTSNYYEYDHMGLGFNYIAWNARKPPFDDARVRRAMTHLVDRDFVLREINRGRGKVAVTYGKPIYPEYSTDLKPLPFSLETATALLAEAGWSDTNGDGVLDKGGKRFEFELKVPSGNRFYDQLAELFGDACKKVGIRMQKRPLEWATFVEDLEERRFEAVSLVASFPDPWIRLLDFASSEDVPRGENLAGWHTPESDALIEQYEREFDHQKRIELFHQFNDMWQTEQPMTLMVHSLVGVLQNNRFENVRVYPTGLRNHAYWVKPENVKYK